MTSILGVNILEKRSLPLGMISTNKENVIFLIEISITSFSLKELGKMLERRGFPI
jgi:hypothetical protein